MAGAMAAAVALVVVAAETAAVEVAVVGMACEIPQDPARQRHRRLHGAILLVGGVTVTETTRFGTLTAITAMVMVVVIVEVVVVVVTVASTA